MQYQMPGVTILAFEGSHPELAEDTFVATGARLIGDLKIGPASSVWFNAVIRADVHFIRIGQLTNIQDNAVIHVTTGGYPTLIGDEVTIGHSAIIHACTIGRRCLIGMGACILDGAVIPDECLVAAGAIVPPGKTYPPRSLIVGSPAIAKRSLSPNELAQLQTSAAHYAELRLKYLALAPPQSQEG